MLFLLVFKALVLCGASFGIWKPHRQEETAKKQFRTLMKRQMIKEEAMRKAEDRRMAILDQQEETEYRLMEHAARQAWGQIGITGGPCELRRFDLQLARLTCRPNSLAFFPEHFPSFPQEATWRCFSGFGEGASAHKEAKKERYLDFKRELDGLRLGDWIFRPESRSVDKCPPTQEMLPTTKNGFLGGSQPSP